MNSAASLLTYLSKLVPATSINPTERQYCLNCLYQHPQCTYSSIIAETIISYISYVYHSYDLLRENMFKLVSNLEYELLHNYDAYETVSQQLYELSLTRKYYTSYAEEIIASLKYKIEALYEQLQLKFKYHTELSEQLEENYAKQWRIYSYEHYLLNKYEYQLLKQGQDIQHFFYEVKRLEGINQYLSIKNEEIIVENYDIKYSNTQIRSYIEYLKNFYTNKPTTTVEIDERNERIKYNPANKPEKEIVCNSNHKIKKITTSEDKTSSRYYRPCLVPLALNEYLLRVTDGQYFFMKDSTNKSDYHSIDSTPRITHHHTHNKYNLCYPFLICEDKHSSSNNSSSKNKPKCEIYMQNCNPLSLSNRDRYKQSSIDHSDNIYYQFFLICTQNAKINSKHFEYIAEVDTHTVWSSITKDKIPMHLWEAYIQEHLKKHLVYCMRNL